MASKNAKILNLPKNIPCRADASKSAFATAVYMIPTLSFPRRRESMTHLLEAHYDIRTVQELLGHANVAHDDLYPRAE